MVRAQDERLKLVVALAKHVGSGAMSCGRPTGLQSARPMLQYSANARDVHMLRSVPGRLCTRGAELFDNAIMTALADFQPPAWAARAPDLYGRGWASHKNASIGARRSTGGPRGWHGQHGAAGRVALPTQASG